MILQSLRDYRVSDDAFTTAWDGITTVAPSQNAVYDRLNDMATATAALIDDAVYDATAWDGIVTKAPSKNATRDKIEAMVAAYTGLVSDTAYSATTWDGDTTHAPSKNAVRDKIETITGLVSDAVYDATGWDAVTTIAPSKNAVRDKIEALAASITALNVTSGTYTPTFTAVANVASSSPGSTNYIRVLNHVLVFGYCGIDPVTTGNAQMGISLPISSNIGTLFDCVGVIMSDSFTEGGSIQGDAANHRALVSIQTVNAGNAGYGFVFGYRVI